MSGAEDRCGQHRNEQQTGHDVGQEVEHKARSLTTF
jgi:hypothetical protein